MIIKLYSVVGGFFNPLFIKIQELKYWVFIFVINKHPVNIKIIR